eukprot:11798677-Ditylum_brightwellii.AAC.1
MGVASKLKHSIIAACSERCGLMWHGHIMFSVRFACSASWHQCTMRKSTNANYHVSIQRKGNDIGNPVCT